MQGGMSANGLLAFRRAVRADPADYGANLNLALYYAQAGDMRQVLQWARARQKEADPERAEAPLLETRALIGLGQRPQAAERFCAAFWSGNPGVGRGASLAARN